MVNAVWEDHPGLYKYPASKEKTRSGPTKMAQQVKVVAAKTNNLKLIPEAHAVGGGNQLPQAGL